MLHRFDQRIQFFGINGNGEQWKVLLEYLGKGAELESPYLTKEEIDFFTDDLRQCVEWIDKAINFDVVNYDGREIYRLITERFEEAIARCRTTGCRKDGESSILAWVLHEQQRKGVSFRVFAASFLI